MNTPDSAPRPALAFGPEPIFALMASIGTALARRLNDRETMLLTLSGATIPAAWLGLWFVLANLMTSE